MYRSVWTMCGHSSLGGTSNGCPPHSCHEVAVRSSCQVGRIPPTWLVTRKSLNDLTCAARHGAARYQERYPGSSWPALIYSAAGFHTLGTIIGATGTAGRAIGNVGDGWAVACAAIRARSKDMAYHTPLPKLEKR